MNRVDVPLRLGVSGSCFAYLMPREVAEALYQTSQLGVPRFLDDSGNRLMVEFMRDMMAAIAASGISDFECYHSPIWDRDAVAAVIESHLDVRVWSVHAPYGKCHDPSSPIDQYRAAAFEAYVDAIDLAERLNARVVVAHPGANVGYETPKSRRLEFAADTLAGVVDYAAERGIRIAIEPLPKQEPGNSLDEVLWLIDRLHRPNVGINFDVNHLFPAQAVPELIRRAGNLVLNVHISDQDGVERHWLPFDGALDWREVIAALRDVGYCGPLIYETHIKGARDCAHIAENIQQNYKRLISVSSSS